MTDEQIIKSMECCVEFKCENCSFDDNSDFACTDILMKDALDIINRQKAEIERLTEENKKLKREMSYMSSPNTIGDRHEMGCW